MHVQPCFEGIYPLYNGVTPVITCKYYEDLHILVNDVPTSPTEVRICFRLYNLAPSEVRQTEGNQFLIRFPAFRFLQNDVLKLAVDGEELPFTISNPVTPIDKKILENRRIHGRQNHYDLQDIVGYAYGETFQDSPTNFPFAHESDENHDDSRTDVEEEENHFIYGVNMTNAELLQKLEGYDGGSFSNKNPSTNGELFQHLFGEQRNPEISQTNMEMCHSLMSALM